MYKTIMRESIPCWYELEWDVDKLAIIFKLHKRAILNNDLLVDGHVQAKVPIVHILRGLPELPVALGADMNGKDNQERAERVPIRPVLLVRGSLIQNGKV